MKKLLLVTLFAATGGLSLLAQIPNSNFENWKSASETLPENWVIFGKAEKVTGNTSTNAITLINDQANGIVSYATQMNLDTGLFYRPAFAYSGNPDSITIHYKALLGMDTAYVQVAFTKAGLEIPVVMCEFTLTGNSGQWTSATFPFAYIQPTPSLTADSGFIVITSADEVFGPLSNGSIEIDAITFKKTNNTASPNIPNHSFENWHSYSAEYPEAWGTTGMFLQKQGLYVNTSAKTTQFYTGSYALELRAIAVDNIASGKTDTFPGQAITLNDPTNANPFDVDVYTPSFPVSSRYTSFRGYLKSGIGSGDIAVAWVNFFKADSVVGSAIYMDASSHSNYTEFSEDIAWDSSFLGNPDSATIMLLVTDSAFSSVKNLNSWAYFDNLRFDNWNTGVFGNPNYLKAGVYPNPSNGQTSLKLMSEQFAAYAIEVFGQDGRMVYQTQGYAEAGRNVIPLNLQALSKGIYIVQVRSNGKEYSEKIIITP